MFQESRELPVTAPTKVGKHHQLAEWMREGAKRTKQCRLMNFNFNGTEVTETCAIAAAAVGAGHDLTREGLYHWMENNVPYALQGRIVRLNDDIGCTREEIANYLCREGGCEHPL